MTEKKRKFWYWYLKIFSVLVACGLPIYAVVEHFPLWEISYGTTRSIGAGAIISLVIVVVVFRRAVFDFIKDRMNLRHAPPLVIWLVMLIVSYVLLYIKQFVRDLTTVFWFGLVGCAVGTALTFVAENIFGKKKEDGNG